jgi:DNA-binding response OmpR family regulator
MEPASGAEVVVVVEDDLNIAELVSMYLAHEGLKVVRASDAAQGLAQVERCSPRMVLIDIGLPGELDGLDLCRMLRAKLDVPVILLTARDDEIDRVLGLELGADDYVPKPFSPSELFARVRAVLRRADGKARDDAPGPLVFGELSVDLERREVRCAGEAIALTPRELDLLAYLVRHHGLALSRRQILDGAWGPNWYGDDRTIDVHIRQLRRKLGDALPLATVWGVGYRLG